MAGPGGGRGRRVLAILFIVSAFAVAIIYFFKWGMKDIAPEGGSDVDRVWLLCLKCGAETSVTSAQFAKLPRDENTDQVRCSKCGELQAKVATFRCPHCNRLIIPNPNPNAPYVCPHCKKSLAPSSAPAGQARP